MESNTATGQRTSGTTVEVPKEEYEQLTRVAELVEVRGDNENPGLEDIWLAGQPVGKIIESNRRKADTAAKEAGATDSSGSDPKGKTDEKGSPSGDLLPIEHLRRLKERDTNHPALPKNGRPSFERAVSIFEHFEDWSSKAPKGRVIKSGLKDLLETAAGERLYWSQIKRACAKLEEYSKGAIRLEKTRRHGNVLVADEQSVLAGGG